MIDGQITEMLKYKSYVYVKLELLRDTEGHKYMLDSTMRIDTPYPFLL